MNRNKSTPISQPPPPTYTNLDRQVARDLSLLGSPLHLRMVSYIAEHGPCLFRDVEAHCGLKYKHGYGMITAARAAGLVRVDRAGIHRLYTVDADRLKAVAVALNKLAARAAETAGRKR